ncbi:MAG: oligopeptide transporter, OPT family, partial [Clostridia bacterium]|nr:oligopeptide transporter, OPT family [Clostridia bacterium]
VMIPLIVMFGQNIVLYPGVDQTIGQMYEAGGASAIWSSYIRYIGAGALAASGIISLVKSLPLIIRTFRDAVGSIGLNGNNNLRTEQDISMKTVLISIVVLTLAVWLIPAIPVSLLGAVVVVVFGFFFAAVSSRMVGLVGSSNNPVSGMAIATLLIATLILKMTGSGGASGMTAAIAIGSIICIVAAIAGDTSQDLKTGYLLGATPKKQQLGEIIGVVASSLAIGGTLYLLDAAWGFGSEQLAAPQATLMKMIIEGVMSAQLPWNLVFVGVFIAVVVEIIGIPVLPFAIGVYLPVHLNACIMVGGLVRLALDKSKKENKDAMINDGILYCSGMIAGEGLAGIVLALLAIFHIDSVIDISGMLNLNPVVANIGSIVLFAVIVLTVLKFSAWRKRK